MITGQNNSKIIFSLPYKINALQFVTLANSQIKTIFDLRNKLIGVYQEAPDEAYVNQLLNDKVQFKTYVHVNDLMNALEDKRLDAVAVAYNRAIYWLANSQSFKLVGPRFHIGQGYGIAAKVGNDKLINEVNNALKQMERDGSYLKIYQLYF